MPRKNSTALEAITEFAEDKSRGPRLYMCPDCGKTLDGSFDTPKFCDDDQAVMTEIARKD